MGIMSHLLAEHSVADAPVAETSTAPPSAPSMENPAACPGCRGVVFWLDVYGAVHCAGCDPLPDRERLVRAMLEVITGADGKPAWVKLGRSANRNRLADDPDELVEFEILAAAGRVLRFLAIDDRRCPPGRVAKPTLDHNGDVVPGTLGRYDPPLAAGPVGDLTFDEWFDRLPVWGSVSGVASKVPSGYRGNH